MQTRGALFPSTVVFFNLHRTFGVEGDTQGINDIDIRSVIFYIQRSIRTAEDTATEIVLIQSLAHGGCILRLEIIYIHASVAYIIKGLLQTVVSIETQLLIFGNNLVEIRVEVDGIIVQLRHRHKMFTDKFRPHVVF